MEEAVVGFLMYGKHVEITLIFVFNVDCFLSFPQTLTNTSLNSVSVFSSVIISSTYQQSSIIGNA